MVSYKHTLIIYNIFIYILYIRVFIVYLATKLGDKAVNNLATRINKMSVMSRSVYLGRKRR